MLTGGDAGGEPMDTVAGLKTNTLVDGFFHVATWILVAVATSLMLRAWQHGQLAPPWRAHAWLLLAGWGAFNLVEGLIDHQLLGLHHVRDDLGGSARLGHRISRIRRTADSREGRARSFGRAVLALTKG